MKPSLMPVPGTRKTEHVRFARRSDLNADCLSQPETCSPVQANAPSFAPIGTEQLDVYRWEALGFPWVAGE